MELEKNLIESVDTARRIFAFLKNSGMQGRISPEEIHNMCLEKYRNFSQAYPLVIALMACEFRYNEDAFIAFLKNMYANPGKGMEGVIEHQSNYAKLLYIHECKKAGNRYSMDIANKIKQQEYAKMYEWYKKIKQNHKTSENEYAAEEVVHIQEKRDEFLSWLQTEQTDRGEIGQGFNPDDFSEEEKSNEDSPEPEPTPEPELPESYYKAMEQRNLLDEERRAREWTDTPTMRQWKKTRR